MDSGVQAWAGMGLFFVGMRLIGAHLQQWAGGPIRALLARTLARPWVPPLAGLLSGAATQSTSTSTFIAAGLVSAGAASVAGTLPLLAWANVGTSALVLLAAVDLKLLVFWLLGLIGCGFFFGLEQQDRWRHALLALLGLALLLLGLSMLKGSVAELRDNPWVQEFVQFAGEGVASSFLLGFILAAAVQSSSVVAVLALPLVHAGLLDLSQATLMVYGANLGSGFAVLLLASGMDGPARQLALCQGLLRAATTLALLGLLALEVLADVPLMLALSGWIAQDLAHQASLIYLFYQCALVLISIVGGRWLAALARRWSPAVEAMSHLQPEYLFDEGVDDPETALSLADLEYRRLVRHLPDFLDGLRAESERSPHGLPLGLRRQASGVIAAEIDDFLAATLRANPEMVGAERVFRARARVGSLRALQDTLFEFTQALGAVPQAERPALAGHMVEGLHAVLGVAADAAGDDPDAVEMLAVLTGERSALMDEVRQALLGGGQGLGGREALLSATLLFERALWMLRQVSGAPSPGQTSGHTLGQTLG